MKDQKTFLEQNIQLLLRAGIPEDVVPDSRLHRRTFRQLKKQIRKQNINSEFSYSALGLLCGQLFLFLFWIVLSFHLDRMNILKSIPLLIMGGILLLNLVSLPITSLIIVKRRQHE